MNTAAQPPNRLNAVFARLAAAAPAPRTALIPYVTAGYPSPQATPKLMHALVAAGADIIELGVPFSDPMADGPVIQQASEYAIAQGVGLPQVLQMVEDFRREDSSTPVVLMGYANPIERMGQTGFVACAQQAGVDGILTVDYPPEEITEFAALLDAANIAPIFLLAPTSSDTRIRQVAQAARGYVYYVSLKGVTGAGHLDIENVIERVNHIRQHVRVPVGVGFGIRDAASAVSLARAADAVIIGSKLLQVMGQAMAQAGIDSPDVSQTQVDQAAIHAARQWLAGISQALKTNA